MPEGGVVTYEEPNETLDDLAGVQLVRFRRPRDVPGAPATERANLFTYVNHGAIPLFAADPARGNYDWMAYSVTEGLMPRFVPDTCDLGGAVLPTNFFAAAREVATTGTNKFHYGENAAASDAVFVPGRRFRLSADLETLSRASGSRLSLEFGLFTGSLKALGSGRILFPEPGAGVRRLSCDFTMEEGAASMFRVMVNSFGDAHGKVSGLALEIVEPDGSTRSAVFEGDVRYNDYMRRWLALYRGSAREFLMNGRHVKPPRHTCEIQGPTDTALGSPAVYVGAFTTWKGDRKALVLANATLRPQKVTWQDGSARSRELAPLEIAVITGE